MAAHHAWNDARSIISRPFQWESDPKILVNNALRHQGYESKATKKLHLTKFFEV